MVLRVGDRRRSISGHHLRPTPIEGVTVGAVSAHAGRIREGYRPHPRHWETLWELVGISPKGSGLAIPAVPKQTEEKLGVKLLASPAEKAHEI